MWPKSQVNSTIHPCHSIRTNNKEYPSNAFNPAAPQPLSSRCERINPWANVRPLPSINESADKASMPQELSPQRRDSADAAKPLFSTRLSNGEFRVTAAAWRCLACSSIALVATMATPLPTATPAPTTVQIPKSDRPRYACEIIFTFWYQARPRQEGSLRWKRKFLW